MVIFSTPAIASPQQNGLPTLWPPPANLRINESSSTCPGPFYDVSSVLPKPDPLTLRTGNAPWKGVFAYLPLVTPSPDDPNNKTRYFIFRGQGVQGKIGAIETPLAVYPAANGEGDCFDPQFSPNYQGIAFKSGYHWHDGHGASRLFYWDFKRQSVTHITGSSVFFPQVAWSPRGSYLAYANGGDLLGTEDDDPTSLSVTDVTSARTTNIVKHPLLRDEDAHDFRNLTAFSWSSDNTLLFSAPNSLRSTASLRPSIFEATLPSGQPKKIISAGYAPLASPDNKWIAFLGWPPSVSRRNKASKSKRGPLQLCLFNRRTSKISVLKTPPPRSDDSGYSIGFCFRWMPDGESLLIVSSRLQLNARKPNAPLRLPQHGLATLRIEMAPHIQELAKKSIALRPMALLQFPRFPEPGESPFEVLQPSRDGSTLFLKIPRYAPQSSDTVQQELVGVNLNTGTSTTLAEFRPQDDSTLGWDWRELP